METEGRVEGEEGEMEYTLHRWYFLSVLFHILFFFKLKVRVPFM
jgi:hypothetical protein